MLNRQILVEEEAEEQKMEGLDLVVFVAPCHTSYDLEKLLTPRHLIAQLEGIAVSSGTPSQ